MSPVSCFRATPIAVKMTVTDYTEVMGDIREPDKAMLICGLLAESDEVLDRAVNRVSDSFGEIVAESATWSFDNTAYYADELGESVRRRFVAVGGYFPMDQLHTTKLHTNELELRFSRDVLNSPDRRRVNIDPGYIHLGALVLATTKPRAHRIYLGRGIHAEVTLVYERGEWRALAWTYPDYSATTYHPFFSQVRDLVKAMRRGGA